ncbi:MAG: GtrA family protein [Bacilli bacterium]|nr:GtrA family protein [Bacilli bacterium]
MEKEEKISTGNELVRFLVTGVICALLDFLTSYGVLALLNKAGMTGFWATAISTTCGFIVGVVLNYLLSTFWVFKNVSDKSKTKTPKFIFFFVLLSACAWGLSVGTMSLCSLVCSNAWGINIDANTDVIIKKLFTFTFWTDVTFWAYFVSFCLRTLVGLVWNYFTRKFILYK